MQQQRRRLVTMGGLALAAGVVLAAVFILLFGFPGGDGADARTEQIPIGDLELDRVELSQNGEDHVIPTGFFHDQIEDLVMNEGLASLTLTFEAEDGDVEGREVTLIDRDNDTPQTTSLDADGKAVFLLDFTLDGQAFRWNPYRLDVEDDERDFEIMVFRANGPGDVTDTPNTPTELGEHDPDRPHTVNDDGEIEVEIDPVFHEAIRRFCGFSVDEVDKVRLEENDQERFMVARVGMDFVQSEHTIAAGQPVWVMVSKDGDRCYINPPCGNPEVPEGKLPPAPPGLQPPPAIPPSQEVPPTATNTPTRGSTSTPTATNTRVVPTSTRVLPSATVPRATNTPQATFTAAPSGCPNQKPKCEEEGGFDPPPGPSATPGQSNPRGYPTAEPTPTTPAGADPYPTEVIRP